MTVTQASQSSAPTSHQRRRFWPTGERLRENIAGWTFVMPATLIIGIFGLLPILYAFYMSLHFWQIQPRYTYCLPNLEQVWNELPRNQRGDMRQLYQLDFSSEVAPNFDLGACFRNYVTIVGDTGGLLMWVSGFLVVFFAWWLWQRIFNDPETGRRRLDRPELPAWVRLALSAGVLVLGLYLITSGWALMISQGNKAFLEGVIITFYFAVGSIPLQLALGLLLAYALFQKIRGKELYRMIFFLPYITPAVAAATIFRIIFSARETSLANQFVGAFGIAPQRWIGEPRPFVNTIFGLNLEGFLAGPSQALVAVILLGIWMYVGYNAVIFLAGLGGIPHDLYEAARVDGASEWHLFRYITLPLISPITFYLSILGFIGTFQAFNTLYVMRTPFAQNTMDTVSIVIFDTFYKASRYGEATAQAILLLLIILAITQFQRSVLEKRVFYG